jgi:hypothetical protein
MNKGDSDLEISDGDDDNDDDNDDSGDDDDIDVKNASTL